MLYLIPSGSASFFAMILSIFALRETVLLTRFMISSLDTGFPAASHFARYASNSCSGTSARRAQREASILERPAAFSASTFDFVPGVLLVSCPGLAPCDFGSTADISPTRRFARTRILEHTSSIKAPMPTA